MSKSFNPDDPAHLSPGRHAVIGTDHTVTIVTRDPNRYGAALSREVLSPAEARRLVAYLSDHFAVVVCPKES